MTRSTDTRRRPPELVARMQAARFTVLMQDMTHIRVPIFAHQELCDILNCARRIDHRGIIEDRANAIA